ncbi:ECF transporter S component [Orenia marismortui]|uniref:Putative membrane protein n=1 Tax=Orenia marismortui TaxID=46469 RepID=A0A4R8HRB6_9FIRM|nr:ECF transporter S component [Orenia marismortui]TDX59127.1 putative membrane protein [Orenia marismortui]
MKITVRQLTIIGILGAISLLLGSTPLGFIPVPTPAGSATIMHIPVIIGAIMEGPVVGGFVGLIFGLFSFLRGGAALFSDPVIAILPRILIGIFSAYSYKMVKNRIGGAGIAAIVGTLTNTVGVLSLAVVKKYLPNWETALTIAITHGLAEVVLAVLITVAIAKGLDRARLD